MGDEINHADDMENEKDVLTCLLSERTWNLWKSLKLDLRARRASLFPEGVAENFWATSVDSKAFLTEAPRAPLWTVTVKSVREM